jgi:hypothetical protein
VLIALAGFGFCCERFRWRRKYSGVMLLITAAIVLANLRIIPTAAPVTTVSGITWYRWRFRDCCWDHSALRWALLSAWR